MAKVPNVVSERIKTQIERAQVIDMNYQSQFEAGLGDLQYILHLLNENKIKIKSTKPTKKETPTDAPEDSDDAQSKPSLQKKSKRCTKRCTVVLEKATNSQINDSLIPLKDDLIENSSSSKRSRRAPVQTTDDNKLTQDKALRKTRLRSQMNVEEKISKELSSPPAKNRKTHEKQTAGTDLLENEIQDCKIENKENSAIPESKRFVQKQIENFEKLNKAAENKEEEVTGRETKHTRLKAMLKSDSQVTASQKIIGVSSSTADKIEAVKTIVKKQSPKEAEVDKHKEQLKRQAKEVVVNKKKEDILKATSEETRRKREKKIQKVAAAREATEREKTMQAAKAEKEKEEKLLQIAAEKEKIKAEKLKKKQQQMQQKLQEIEERRKREEEARIAKLREQEEEHKRILAIKEKEMDLQRQKAAELRLAEAEKAKLQNQTSKLNKLAAVNNAEAKLKAVNPPDISKSKNNYGIDDAKSGDSSDDESRPKKPIPLWAQPKKRHHLLVVNSFVPKEIWPLFMECNSDPDVNQMFPGMPIKKRIRTSSAVWNTPPLCLHLTPNKKVF